MKLTAKKINLLHEESNVQFHLLGTIIEVLLLLTFAGASFYFIAYSY